MTNRDNCFPPMPHNWFAETAHLTRASGIAFVKWTGRHYVLRCEDFVNPSWRRHMYDIGEKPGTGTYCCSNNCGWRVTLDDSSDVLPPCGNCGKGQKIKYYRC